MMSGFDGGLMELGSLDKARDTYEAVGIWWAQAILQVHFDAGTSSGYYKNSETAEKMRRRETLMRERAMSRRNEIQEHIGAFALSLAYLARERSANFITVDLEPAPILVDAAKMAGLRVETDNDLFPFESATWVSNNKAQAKLGFKGESRQIWPYVPPPDPEQA